VILRELDPESSQSANTSDRERLTDETSATFESRATGGSGSAWLLGLSPKLMMGGIIGASEDFNKHLILMSI
jgi:hypothetical protein